MFTFCGAYVKYISRKIMTLQSFHILIFQPQKTRESEEIDGVFKWGNLSEWFNSLYNSTRHVYATSWHNISPLPPLKTPAHASDGNVYALAKLGMFVDRDLVNKEICKQVMVIVFW